MLRIIKLIFQALLVAYLVIFSVNNSATVTFKPFMNVAVYEIPLFLLVIITLFAGIILGALAMYAEKAGLSAKIRRLNKEIKANEKEIERLQKLTVSQETKNNETVVSEENKPIIENKEEVKQDDIKEALR